MVLNPDIQKKLHEEINLVVKNNRLPNWNDAENMPSSTWLQATLCKVQRASGMLVVGGTSAIRDMKIAGYHISKGIFVALNLVKLHHDEREWPEPKKFRPERFLDSNGKFVGWSKPNGFLPFSVGRGKCPGQSLAKIMMITFASTLINCYKFELPEGEEIPTIEVFESAAVKRPEDFKIVANKQES